MGEREKIYINYVGIHVNLNTVYGDVTTEDI